MLKKYVLAAFAMLLLTAIAPQVSNSSFGWFFQGLKINEAQAGCSDNPYEGVDWEGCRKRNLMLGGADLKNSNLKGTNFTSTDMRESEIDGANFHKSVLLRVAFDGSSAKETNFEKAIVYRVSFKNTDLTNAVFQKTEMLRVNFSGATLIGVNFSKSESGRSIFDDSVLGNNNFSFSNLARADFRKAKIGGPIDFAGAYFFQTRMEGVDFSTASGLQQWQIDMACGDDNTKLPQGLNRPDDWKCGDE